jgi:hypothetical protein
VCVCVCVCVCSTYHASACSNYRKRVHLRGSIVVLGGSGELSRIWGSIWPHSDNKKHSGGGQ